MDYLGKPDNYKVLKRVREYIMMKAERWRGEYNILKREEEDKMQTPLVTSKSWKR